MATSVAPARGGASFQEHSVPQQTGCAHQVGESWLTLQGMAEAGQTKQPQEQPLVMARVLFPQGTGRIQSFCMSSLPQGLPNSSAHPSLPLGGAFPPGGGDQRGCSCSWMEALDMAVDVHASAASSPDRETGACLGLSCPTLSIGTAPRRAPQTWAELQVDTRTSKAGGERDTRRKPVCRRKVPKQGPAAIRPGG